jgi:hypothetical protein
MFCYLQRILKVPLDAAQLVQRGPDLICSSALGLKVEDMDVSILFLLFVL